MTVLGHKVANNETIDFCVFSSKMPYRCQSFVNYALHTSECLAANRHSHVIYLRYIYFMVGHTQLLKKILVFVGHKLKFTRSDCQHREDIDIIEG